MDQGARSLIKPKSISIVTASVCSSVKTLELLRLLFISSSSPSTLLFLPACFSVCVPLRLFFFYTGPYQRGAGRVLGPISESLYGEREKKGPGATRSPSLSPSARHSLISFNSPVSSVAGGSRKAPGRKKGGGVLSDVVTRSMLSQWTSLSPELSTKVPQLGDSSQARLKASARRLLGSRKDDDTNSCQRRRFLLGGSEAALLGTVSNCLSVHLGERTRSRRCC